MSAINKIQVGGEVRDVWSTSDDIIDAKDSILNKIDSSTQDLSNKVGNIDLSEVSKQGTDPGATNTVIYEEVRKIDNLNTNYDKLVNIYDSLLSMMVIYDGTTGNLTIENVKLIIE